MLVLIVAIVAIEMIPFRLTEERAWLVVVVGAATAIVLGSLLAFKAVPVVGRPTSAILGLARHIGLPLLGLAFFAFWTVVYAGMWAFNPDEAFGGVAEHPRLADFFYYSVSTAFTSPPEGIAAGSRGVRSATMIELLTALALIGVYLSSIADWRAAPESDKVT